MKSKRFCLFCHQSGITITFVTGKELKRHIRDRHPQTKEQVQANRSKLREYRKQILLQAGRLGYKI